VLSGRMDGQTDRQTDRHTDRQTDMMKLIVAFGNFANADNNHPFLHLFLLLTSDRLIQRTRREKVYTTGGCTVRLFTGF
jgi:hypothetical protein